MMTFVDLYPQLYPTVDMFTYTSDRTKLAKAVNLAGRTTGKVKNFFSKTETKVSTLFAYWAADTFVALSLLMMAFSIPMLTIVSFLVAIHTYATFSIIYEIYS